MALHDWNFMLITRTIDKVEEKFYHGSCHAAKSQAGKEFHKDDMARVTVFDTLGNIYLYLVAGHPEKTENVKSPY
jgi:RPA family protein